MRTSSPNHQTPLFSNSQPPISPPRSRTRPASLIASPPRFQSTISSGSPPRTQVGFGPRVGGTASERLRQEKEALQAELENVKRMSHGLQVQYDALRMDHQATSQDYDVLRQEIQVLRREQAELGWDHGQLALENMGFKKMKGEIMEEDAMQTRAYEDMAREIAHLKQKIKEIDLIDRRRKYDSQINDLEATLRHAQSKVDTMYSNPHSRIGETMLDPERSRLGFIDRPLPTLLPAGLLSPRGNVLGSLADNSIRGEVFLSPRVHRESSVNPQRISPLKNPLSDPNFLDRNREVIQISPPKVGAVSHVLASPPAHIDRSIRYDDNRLSIVQPVTTGQVIHPIPVSQTIQHQHFPINQPPVRHTQPLQVSQVLPPVGGGQGPIVSPPIQVIGAPVAERELSLFEKPFAFPNKYSQMAANAPI